MRIIRYDEHFVLNFASLVQRIKRNQLANKTKTNTDED